jgi:hypothetical protein
MPTPRLTDDVLRAAIVAVDAADGNLSAAARGLGISRTTLQVRYYAARARLSGIDWPARKRAHRGEVGGPPIPAIAVPPDGFEIKENAGRYDANGNLKRQYVKTKQSPGDVFDPLPGQIIKGESALVDPEGRVLVKWVKTKEGSGEELVEALKRSFTNYDGGAPTIEQPDPGYKDAITVYPLPDLHVGMHAWHCETGDDYDTKIAIELAMRRVEELVAQSLPTEHAVILGLGDYFHANDNRGATPQSGNRLDVDGRWAKVFEAGATLATRIIDLAARKHANVEGVFLPGNHDPDAAITLTVALSMFYSNVPHVTIFKEPTIAWFRRFGRVLLGATHGHTMKPEQMAMMMAADRPEDWGNSVFRHIFYGHVHHETARELAGCRVESLSSLAPRDAWNSAMGFLGGRAMSAITFHRELGESGRHRVNILSSRE